MTEKIEILYGDKIRIRIDEENTEKQYLTDIMCYMARLYNSTKNESGHVINNLKLAMKSYFYERNLLIDDIIIEDNLCCYISKGNKIRDATPEEANGILAQLMDEKYLSVSGYNVACNAFRPITRKFIIEKK